LVPAGQARAGNSVLWVVMCVHLAEGYGLEDFDDLNSSEPLKSRGSGGTTPGGGARAGSGMERQPSGGSTPGDARRQGGGGGGSSSSAGQVSSSRASGSAPDSDLRRLLFKFPDVSDESRAVVIALLMTGSLARTWSRFEEQVWADVMLSRARSTQACTCTRSGRPCPARPVLRTPSTPQWVAPA
jgi:hypothetical protein